MELCLAFINGHVPISSGFGARHSHHLVIFYWKENKCMLKQCSSFSVSSQIQAGRIIYLILAYVLILLLDVFTKAVLLSLFYWPEDRSLLISLPVSGEDWIYYLWMLRLGFSEGYCQQLPWKQFEWNSYFPTTVSSAARNLIPNCK